MTNEDLSSAIKSIIEKELKSFSKLIPKDILSNVEKNIAPQIENIIEQSGFILGQTLEVNDDLVPRGFIISQNPVAGTKMSPGSSVDLVISNGPSLIEISDLSRKSLVDAIQILETLGLEYEFVEEYSEDVSVGLVSHTLPAAGEIVTPDQTISVIVSLGIKVEVPEVEGLGYQEALDILEEAGLVATISGDTNGKIVKQIPRGGELADPETPIELTFEDWNLPF